MFFIEVSLFPPAARYSICEYSMAEMGFEVGNFGAKDSKYDPFDFASAHSVGTKKRHCDCARHPLPCWFQIDVNIVSSFVAFTRAFDNFQIARPVERDRNRERHFHLPGQGRATQRKPICDVGLSTDCG
jgi:hypothetical protein